MKESYGFTAFNLNGDIISTRRTRKQFESLAKEVGQRYHASEIDIITAMIFGSVASIDAQEFISLALKSFQEANHLEILDEANSNQIKAENGEKFTWMKIVLNLLMMPL